MGQHQSKTGTTKHQVAKSGSDDKAVRSGTAAAFRAIDARNVNRLRKALSVGAPVGSVRRSAGGSGGSSTTQTRSMSLLEYAVDKNFLPGVEIMLKVCFHFYTFRCRLT